MNLTAQQSYCPKTDSFNYTQIVSGQLPGGVDVTRITQ
jgi:hypothetical protein